VRGILSSAGFEAVSLTPHDARIGGGGIDTYMELAFKVGPLGAALRESPHLASVVSEAVRAAITPYATPEGPVLMPAAVWIVQARNPD
jgi:hypothetical protein